MQSDFLFCRSNLVQNQAGSTDKEQNAILSLAFTGISRPINAHLKHGTISALAHLIRKSTSS